MHTTYLHNLKCINCCCLIWWTVLHSKMMGTNNFETLCNFVLQLLAKGRMFCKSRLLAPMFFHAMPVLCAWIVSCKLKKIFCWCVYCIFLILDLMCECVKLHDYLRLNSSSCLVATYMHYTPVPYVVAVGNYGLCMRWWVSCMQQLRTCCALRTGYSAPALLRGQRQSLNYAHLPANVSSTLMHRL